MKIRKRLICFLAVLGIMLGMFASSASAVNGTQFSDVKETDWFFQSVQYVCAHGIMNGSSGNSFAPQDKTTRGMIVTMLYRYDGSPVVSGQCPFGDVAAGKYYRKAVIWAAENQIVGGLGGDRFGPDEPVTREQLAAILYRYANYKGYDTQRSVELAKFADRDDVGSYAVNAVKWAVADGLLSGVSATELQPKGFAIRAQVAAILMRFCEGTASGEPAAASDEKEQENTKPAGSSGSTESGDKADSGESTEKPDVPAQSGFGLSVESVKASAGDKLVTVRISVKDNPGILGMRFSVSYDESVLTLTGALNGDAVSRILTLTKAKTLCSGCNFVWDGIEIDTEDVKDGTVLELQFRVSDSAAAGNYPITIRYNSGDIVDNDLQKLSPYIQNGYISIK
ncbi:MAG: S-layer homology domain-containing protein [Oscillospiraceae bacterium]|jgi:hypothetical protein